MNNLFKLSLLAVFLVPLSGIIPLRGTDIWYVQYLGLFCVLLFGIILVLWQTNKYLSLIVAVGLYSTIVVAHQNPRAILCLIQIALSCLAIHIISKFSYRQRMMLLKTLLVFMVLNGLYVIVQSLNMDPIFNYKHDVTIDDPVGLSGSHNQAGLFFGVTTPLALAFCPSLIVFNILGLWLSSTASAWVGTLVGVGTFLFFRVKKFAIFLLTLSVILFCVYFNKVEAIDSIKYKERANVVLQAIDSVTSGKIVLTKGDLSKIVTCNPLFGYGLGNFMRLAPYAQNEFIHFTFSHRYAHAHNDYAEWFFETGYIGLLALLAFLINFFWNFIRAKKTKILVISFSCIIVHMVTALGIFTIHTAVSGMLLIIFLGIFEGERRGLVG